MSPAICLSFLVCFFFILLIWFFKDVFSAIACRLFSFWCAFCSACVPLFPFKNCCFYYLSTVAAYTQPIYDSELSGHFLRSILIESECLS